ncbi:unnamed protein product [Haemonchus placei]|uniref:DNA primase n=1 Tax=Haemonchus placei TaxID=6290 RepID=A0A0N4VT43_HAEPC|nr:unnamed protein product [Haemonchus placei]
MNTVPIPHRQSIQFLLHYLFSSGIHIYYPPLTQELGNDDTLSLAKVGHVIQESRFYQMIGKGACPCAKHPIKHLHCEK